MTLFAIKHDANSAIRALHTPFSVTKNEINEIRKMVKLELG